MNLFDKNTTASIIAASIHGGTIFASLSLLLSLTRELGNEKAFIVAMITSGLLLGGLAGTTLPVYRIKNALPLIIGTVAATLFFGFLMLSINLFFDPDNLRSRLLIALTLLAWTPGTFIGWLIHLQVTERKRHNLIYEEGEQTGFLTTENEQLRNTPPHSRILVDDKNEDA